MCNSDFCDSPVLEGKRSPEEKDTHLRVCSDSVIAELCIFHVLFVSQLCLQSSSSPRRIFTPHLSYLGGKEEETYWTKGVSIQNVPHLAF